MVYNNAENALSHIKHLEEEIILTVNPTEEDHKALLEQIRTMIIALESGPRKQDFPAAAARTRKLTQPILKTEWDRVRGWRSLRRLWRRLKNMWEKSNH